VAIIIEELAYYSFPVATCVETTTLMPLFIMHTANEEQKRKYLPAMARFDMFVGFMLTDEGAGTDPARMKTRAERDGDYYVLNGKKRLISMAEFADAFIVFARTHPTAERRALSAFIVERNTPGLILARRQKCFGMGGHQTWVVALDNCRIPKANLLGEEGQGFRYALMMLDDSRSTLATGYIGLARAAYDAAANFARERVTFGRPLIQNQAISYPLAELATMIEAARLLAYKATAMAERGIWHKKETSMAKYYAAELAIDASLLAISIIGGEGTTPDYPVERFLRDAVTFQFAQGAINTQKLVITQELFKT